MRDEIDIARERRIVRDLVRAGNRRVRLPVGLTILAGIALSFALFPFVGAWMLAVMFGGIAVAWVVHAIMVKRWWRWATDHDVDIGMLRQAAADRRIVSQPNSWMGRLEERTLERNISPERIARESVAPTVRS